MTSTSSNFTLVEPQKCLFVHDALTKSQLTKWDMAKHMKFQVFRYFKYYHKMQAQELVMDLLNDPKAREVLQVMLKDGSWLPLTEPVRRVEVESVPCSLTRMDLFDRISEADPQIVRPNGDIIKCMEDVRDGFQISDMLRDMLLNEESENAELFSEAERQEFLWRVFEHIALGGSCCQFEDKLEPYLETTKKIYKEMLTVQKNPNTGKVEVAATLFAIKSIETESSSVHLFPKPSRNSFCYVSVDPLRRLARLWYHAFVPFW